MQCKLNTWNEIGGLVALMWSYGFDNSTHLDNFFPCPESVEEQAAYNQLISTWEFHLYHKAENEQS